MAGSSATRKATSSRRVPSALAQYLALTAGLTVLTAIALLYYVFLKHAPLDAQMWSEPQDRFGDFYHYRNLFAVFHTRAFFTAADRFAYPAPCAVIYAWLFSLGTQAHAVYDLLLASAALASSSFLYRRLRGFGLASWKSVAIAALLLATSYPWFRLWDRGNLELFVYLFLATGVWAYLTGRHSLAAALWGCAGAMKIYPLALLVMFLGRGRWRSFGVGVATCAAVLLASFWYVGPTVREAALGSLHGITGFVDHYAGAARRSELNIDHSLLGAIKELLSLNILHLGERWPRLSVWYQVLVAVAAPVLFWTKISRLGRLNRLCLLLIAIVLLPPVSYDYTLVHVYLVLGIVLGVYLDSVGAGRPFAGAKVYFACFAVLFTSQTWVQLRGLRVNGLLKCVVLLILSGLLLRLPLTMKPDAEAPVA